MKILGILLVVPILLWGGIRIQKNISFGIECSGRMKRAADASNVEIAKTEMQHVVKYLENNNMTSGYTTALFWKGPNEDVGFFYQNMKGSLEELNEVSNSGTALEQSNALMKLRETLLDNAVITYPPGLEIFPNNTGYAIFGCLSLLVAVIGVALFFKDSY